MRAIDKVGAYIIHLGVNDLKSLAPTKVIELLKKSLIHLLETSAAKVIFSTVLPVYKGHLNNKIKHFNNLAEDLITELRGVPSYADRLFTNFNRGFTRYEVQENTNLYDPDQIHLNLNGTAKLCFYLFEALRRSKALPNTTIPQHAAFPRYIHRYR